MLGEFDFSDEKLQDTIGVLPPKTKPRSSLKIGSRQIAAKSLRINKIPKILLPIWDLYAVTPKLTPHQRDQVRTMLKDGQSVRAIARHFNVGIATIDRIKRTMTLS